MSSRWPGSSSARTCSSRRSTSARCSCERLAETDFSLVHGCGQDARTEPATPRREPPPIASSCDATRAACRRTTSAPPWRRTGGPARPVSAAEAPRKSVGKHYPIPVVCLSTGGSFIRHEERRSRRTHGRIPAPRRGETSGARFMASWRAAVIRQDAERQGELSIRSRNLRSSVTGPRVPVSAMTVAPVRVSEPRAAPAGGGAAPLPARPRLGPTSHGVPWERGRPARPGRRPEMDNPPKARRRSRDRRRPARFNLMRRCLHALALPAFPGSRASPASPMRGQACPLQHTGGPSARCGRDARDPRKPEPGSRMNPAASRRSAVASSSPWTASVRACPAGTAPTPPARFSERALDPSAADDVPE